jgi:hypothetical protein
MKQTENSEPPSCVTALLFLVGRNARGHWVVRELNGERGGFFVDCASALRYVRSESGDARCAAVMTRDVVDLFAGKIPSRPVVSRIATVQPEERRVA